MTEEVVQPAAEPASTVEPARDPNKVYTQAEIDAITAKVRKNERYRTRKEIEAYYQGRESVAPKAPETTPEPPKEDPAPTRDKYASYEEFLEAKAEYTGRKAARDEHGNIQKSEAEKKAQEEKNERAKNFQTKVREKYPDIDSRLEEVGNMPMYRGVQDAISESEFGADIFNELVATPAEFERLSKMSETSAVREIGKIEARLEAAAKAAPAGDPPKSEPVKEPSRAPTPIKPIVSKTVVSDGEPSHDNPDAWKRWRDRQVHQKKAGAK